MVDDELRCIDQRRQIVRGRRLDLRHVAEDHAQQVQIVRQLLAQFLCRLNLLVIHFQFSVGAQVAASARLIVVAFRKIVLPLIELLDLGLRILLRIGRDRLSLLLVVLEFLGGAAGGVCAAAYAIIATQAIVIFFVFEKVT